MIRKSIAVFLTFFGLLICACLTAGCGGGHSPAPSEGGSDTSVSADAGKDDTDKDDTNKDGANIDDADKDDAGKDGANINDADKDAPMEWTTSGDGSAPQTVSPKGDPSFTEVIADNSDLYFAVTDAYEDPVYGYVWSARIENRTDKNLMFTFEKTSVNGVMCDPFWADVISPGAQADRQITWMRETLDACGIDEVTEVDFTLNVYNDDDYTEGALMHDPFEVFPAGREKAAAAKRTPLDTDRVLIDNDRCRILLTGIEPEGTWGYTVYLWLENRSDEDLMFSAQNTTINGTSCDPYWADVVSAGKSARDTVIWDRGALEESGIKEVSRIELPFLVYSEKDIAHPYVNETAFITP